MLDIIIIGGEGEVLEALQKLSIKAESLGEFVREKTPWTKISQSEWLYIATLPPRSHNLLLQVAEFAHENGVKIAFRPEESEIRQGLKKIKHILKVTSILVLDIDRASQLTGIPREEPDTILKKLRSIGTKIVVITDAKGDVQVFDGKTKYLKSPYDVRIDGTSGAGKAFSAGFLAGYIKKGDINYSINVGCANAASVLMNYGFLKAEELISFINKLENETTKIRKSNL